MTQYRHDNTALSNYIDALLAGIGKRGSSFTDVDSCAWRVGALSHDKDGHFFLIQEFKEPLEKTSRGQTQALWALAGLPRVTVWLVRVYRETDEVEVTDLAPRNIYADFPEIRMPISAYKELVEGWWARHETTPLQTSRQATWGERAARDESLRAFVDAEIARAEVEVSALRVECAHLRRVVAAQTLKATLATPAEAENADMF